MYNPLTCVPAVYLQQHLAPHLYMTLSYSEVGSKGFRINKGSTFYVFETNLFHLSRCCFQHSFHIAALRSQRDGKTLELFFLLLIFCNAGYLELTLTPWKCPRWVKILLISSDLILKDEKLHNKQCNRVLDLPCQGSLLLFLQCSIGVASVAKVGTCSSKIFQRFLPFL